MSCFTKIRRNRVIVFYLILVHTIIMTMQKGEYMTRIIRCYTCSGGLECGTLFTPNSYNNAQHLAHGDELLYSCSITISHEGVTTRGLIPSATCRSSAYQFCCKDDLCNYLPSPPLPVFTSLTCIIGRCQLSDDKCDDSHTAFRSSAAESCSLIMEQFGSRIYKSYQKGCSPGLTDVIAEPIEESITYMSFCCNTFECSQRSLSNSMAIGCYVCDSRVTGLIGCSILNASSPHVYKTGSSSSSEACATIVGLMGQDATSNISYPAFTIRTYIANCSSQSPGTVSYGGATFQGRINCCWTSYCNTEALDVYLTPAATVITTTTAIAATTKRTTTTTTRKTTSAIKTTRTATTLAIQTTTATATTTTTRTTIQTTTTDIKRTTNDIKTGTKTTKTGGGLHVLKIVLIVLAVVAICGLAVCILQVTRRLNGRQHQLRGRRYLLTDSTEEMPLSSPVEPSTLPFLQD